VSTSSGWNLKSVRFVVWVALAIPFLAFAAKSVIGIDLEPFRFYAPLFLAFSAAFIGLRSVDKWMWTKENGSNGGQ